MANRQNNLVDWLAKAGKPIVLCALVLVIVFDALPEAAGNSPAQPRITSVSTDKGGVVFEWTLYGDCDFFQTRWGENGGEEVQRSQGHTQWRHWRSPGLPRTWVFRVQACNNTLFASDCSSWASTDQSQLPGYWSQVPPPPPPPPPPSQYIGKFQTKTPNAVFAQKRALYAVSIDEPLVAPAGAAIDVPITFEQCHKLLSSPGCPVTPTFEQWAYDAATHRLLHVASGKCVNISGARRDAGAPIILYPCAGAANEKWTIIAPAGQSTWTVKSDFNGMCLHAIPGRRSTGPNQRVGIMTAATLAQMPCNASAAQRFSNVDADWSRRNGPR